MPIAVPGTGHLLTPTADGSSACARQVGPGEVIYPRIAQNYYEILKKTTTKLQQTKTYIYSNSVSAAITTLNIDFMWRDKDMKKQKRKEKEKKRKKTYEATLQTQIWINRGVGSGWAAAYGSGRAQHPAIFFYYHLVKEKWSKFSHFPTNNVLSFNRYYI